MNIRMLMIVASCSLLALLSGCMRSLLEVQNENGEPPTLFEVVQNKAGSGFKVFQILEDGSVLVNHPGWQHYEINIHTGIRADTYSESFLDLHVVPLVKDYVDEQGLKSGLYQYEGVYEYTTTNDKKRKIRNFVEVVQ